MDREAQQAKDLAAGRADGGGSDEHVFAAIDDKLHESAVPRAVDPASEGGRERLDGRDDVVTRPARPGLGQARLIGWTGKVLAENPDQRAELVDDRARSRTPSTTYPSCSSIAARKILS